MEKKIDNLSSISELPERALKKYESKRPLIGVKKSTLSPLIFLSKIRKFRPIYMQ
jgi:hypothetical protein